MSTRCRAGASLLSRRPLLGIITGLLLLSPPVHAAPHTVVRKAGDAWHVRTALCLTGKKVHGFLEQTWSPEGQLLSLALSLGESLLANSGVARLCQHVSEPWAGWQAVGRVQRQAELEDFAEDRTCTVPDAPKRVRQQRELDDFRAMLRRLAYLEGRGIASLYGSNACRGEDGRQCLFDWTLVPDKVVQPPVRPVQPPLDRYFGRHTPGRLALAERLVLQDLASWQAQRSSLAPTKDHGRLTTDEILDLLRRQQTIVAKWTRPPACPSSVQSPSSGAAAPVPGSVPVPVVGRNALVAARFSARRDVTHDGPVPARVGRPPASRGPRDGSLQPLPGRGLRDGSLRGWAEPRPIVADEGDDLDPSGRGLDPSLQVPDAGADFHLEAFSLPDGLHPTVAPVPGPTAKLPRMGR